MANRAVLGIYSAREEVIGAMDALLRAGYRKTDISALVPENGGTRDLAYEKNTKASEGIFAGTASGILVGGTMGWLVGISALALPGLGPLIAAGPVITAMAGAGAGAVTCGIAGALTGFGMPKYVARRYKGASRVVVFCFRCIAMTENGSRELGQFWKRLVHGRFHPPPKRRQTLPGVINPCRDQVFATPQSSRGCPDRSSILGS